MENSMDFDFVEVPSYEEFKETLTRALNSNPLNWTRKRPVLSCVNEKGGSMESQTLSEPSGSSQENQSENSSNGASSLNPQASSIFRRRQNDKGHLGKRPANSENF